MNELIKVDYSGERPAVSARELHEFLEVKTAYKDWFPRMCEYGFTEGNDYCSFLSDRVDGLPGKPRQDAAISIDMAKEICMLQRNEKGKLARQYFLQLERDWNSPEKIMARALRIAEQQLKAVQDENQELQVTNSRLIVENQIMQPKADYFDDLVSRNLLTSFRETAKLLGVPPRKFTQFLLDHKYIFRDKKGQLKPYAPYTSENNKLFDLKEQKNDKTGWVGTQTMVTPKGRETFRLLMM